MIPAFDPSQARILGRIVRHSEYILNMLRTAGKGKHENAEKVEKQVDTCNIVLSVLRVVVVKVRHATVAVVELVIWT